MTSKVNSFLLAGIWLTDSLSGGCVGGQEDEVEEIKTRQLCCYSAGFQLTLAFWWGLYLFLLFLWFLNRWGVGAGANKQG